MENPQDSQLPPETQEAFGSMRKKLLDSYEAMNEGRAVKISKDAQKMFNGLMEQGGREVPTPPPVYEVADSTALNQELATILENTPNDNAKIADAFVRHSRYNFNPWTLGDDYKATFAAIDKALAPSL